ncbi:MAG TPA: ATP-binding protein, partial [Thermoanaerobaculia bacterium]|nr:ATP-binding protein [Thermoanaerobaculia bacterium]
LAMLGHELRNPLAPIRAATEVLRLSGAGDSSTRWASDVIHRQTRQLSRLVDDLLDVSRVTRGKIELHREDIDLAAVVAQAVETSRPLIDSRRHTLTLALPAEPVHLHADLTRLAQVVANLLNNAAKYMQEGGDIRLSAELQGDRVVLRVKDEGIGIPREMLPRVFDLFTQVHGTLDRAESGLGIGLALVRSLVEQHGGTVEARSEGSGRGSEFVVTLPVVEDRQLPLPGLAGAAAGRQSGGRRILVVDDNLDVAESMGLFLEMAGHEIRMAHDGEAVLPLVESYRPEAVLLDIGLPGIDGYEVARRLRLDPRNDGVLLVAITGYGREQDRDRGKMAGFDHYLVKPVDPDVLRALLASPRQMSVA